MQNINCGFEDSQRDPKKYLDNIPKHTKTAILDATEKRIFNGIISNTFCVEKSTKKTVFIAPSKFPDYEEKRYTSAKREMKVFPIIYHLFQRHPMDYLRIIDAYNSVKTEGTEKIPEDHYLDETTEKIKEIDACEHHESAEKFLFGVQNILMGMCCSPLIKKSDKCSDDEGLLMMDTIANNHDNNDSVNSIYKKFIELRKEDLKTDTLKIHAFLPIINSVFENSNKKDILFPSTLFTEDKQDNLFFNIEKLDSISRSLNILNYDGSEYTYIIKVFQKKIDEFKEIFNTKYVKLEHEYAFLKGKEISDTDLKFKNITSETRTYHTNFHKSVQEEKGYQEMIHDLQIMLNAKEAFEKFYEATSKSRKPVWNLINYTDKDWEDANTRDECKRIFPKSKALNDAVLIDFGKSLPQFKKDVLSYYNYKQSGSYPKSNNISYKQVIADSDFFKVIKNIIDADAEYKDYYKSLDIQSTQGN